MKDNPHYKLPLPWQVSLTPLTLYPLSVTQWLEERCLQDILCVQASDLLGSSIGHHLHSQPVIGCTCEI